MFFKTRIVELSGYKVGFASLNSAWRATGAPNEADRNRLILGERAVDLAIADLGDTDIRVCLAHHPLEWLLEEDSIAIENRLFDAFDIVCFGHTHRAQPRQYISPLATTVISQSGSVYANRRWFNGYQIIEWDDANRKAKLKCRMYLDNPRRAFVPAENVAPGGLAEFELKRHANKAQLTEIELFLRQGRAGIRESADDHISFARGTDGKTISFSDAFVCQPLIVKAEPGEVIDAASASKSTRQDRTADQLLREGSTIALLGEADSGRTSLLHHLAIRVSEGVCDQSRIPAVVNVPLAVEVGYEQVLRTYYDSADVKRGVLNSVIRSLNWIVFLDDFDGASPRHLALIDDIRTKFPSHRIVVTTSESSLRDLKRRFPEDKITAVEIGSLPRKSIRQLARVRFSKPLGTGMDDAAYFMVMKHINEAGLPRTGYMVALLLWAAEQETLGQSLNEAVLLENLISFLLGKTNFEAALRNQFDPRAQEFLLRAIATKLRESGGWVKSNDLLIFIVEYFTSRGLGHGAKEVLEEFISCKLFVEREGHIGFRYSCYQAYFVAFDLRQDPKKLEKLLGETEADKVLDYSRELDLWSSLSRELQGADAAMFKLLETVGLSVSGPSGDLGRLKFVGRELQLKKERVAELLANPPTKDQIDEIWDKMDSARSGEHEPSAEEIEVESGADDGTEERQREAVIRLSMQRAALMLFAKIIRNCDQEKIELKKELVEKTLMLWSAHTFALSELMSHIIDVELPKQIEKQNLPSKLTADDLNRINNIVMMLVAYGDASEVAANLTNDSLKRPMLELASNLESPEGARFFAAFAFTENWDAEGIRAVRSFLKSAKNLVLKHASLQKMLHDYRFQRYRLASADAFRDLIAETEIILDGGARMPKSARIASLKEEAKVDDGQ